MRNTETHKQQPIWELVKDKKNRQELVQAQTKEDIMELYKNILQTKTIENNTNKNTKEEVYTLEQDLFMQLDKSMSQIAQKTEKLTGSDYGIIYMYAKIHKCDLYGTPVDRNKPGMGTVDNLQAILDQYIYSDSIQTLENLSHTDNITQVMEQPTIRNKIWTLPDHILQTLYKKHHAGKKLLKKLDDDIQKHTPQKDPITLGKLAEVSLVARMRNRPKRMLTLPKLIHMLDDPQDQTHKEVFKDKKVMKDWTYGETEGIFTFIFGQGAATDEFLEKAQGDKKPLLAAIAVAYHEKGIRFWTDNATDGSTDNTGYFGTFQLSKRFHTDIINQTNENMDKQSNGQKDLYAWMRYLDKIGQTKTRDRLKNASIDDMGTVIADIQLQNAKDAQRDRVRQTINNMITKGYNPHKFYQNDPAKLNLNFFASFPERADKRESISQNRKYAYKNTDQIYERKNRTTIPDPLDELDKA